MATGRTNSTVGESGGFFPHYTGSNNLVISENGQSGYMEFYTSGTLTWRNDEIPKTVDATCVGGGGAGSKGATYNNDTALLGGSGGGGGYVNSLTGIVLSGPTDVVVGAGGTGNGGAGGTSSFGSFLSADGGTGAYTSMTVSKFITRAGSGGNAGGVGAGDESPVFAAPGCSNGAQPAPVQNPSQQEAGTSQGTPTVDILGRRHAGGGGGAGRHWKTTYPTTTLGAAGGVSDLTEGSGANGQPGNANFCGLGGGGFGGGGGAGGGEESRFSGSPSTFYAPGAGGQGFVMIGWGDYLKLYQEGGNA